MPDLWSPHEHRWACALAFMYILMLREIHIQSEIHKQRGRERHTQRHREIQSETELQRDTERDTHTERHRDIHTEGQTHK